MPDDVDWAFVFRVDPNGTVSRVYSTIPDKRFVELTEGSPSNIGMTKGISPISQVSDHLHPINVSRNFCAKNLNYITHFHPKIGLLLKNFQIPNLNFSAKNEV